MKSTTLFFLTFLFMISCSSKRQVVYFNDVDSRFQKNTNHTTILKQKKAYNIQQGDILKIDVKTIIPEAAFAYNNLTLNNNPNNFDMLMLDGYKVCSDMTITYPILGKISVDSLTTNQLEEKITKLLLDGGHLTKPTVKINRLNSKFTVLGEVNKPGTYSYVDESLNVFQALGYAGDLTINGKRKDIILIREVNEGNKVYSFNLNKSNLLKKEFFYIKNNDIIVVEPNFSKVKSAGFIGSPSSIASISSLLLSITLLIIN